MIQHLLILAAMTILVLSACTHETIVKNNFEIQKGAKVVDDDGQPVDRCDFYSKFRINTIAGRDRMKMNGDSTYNIIAIDDGQVIATSFANLTKFDHKKPYCKYLVTYNYRNCTKTIYVFSGLENVHPGDYVKKDQYLGTDYDPSQCSEDAFKKYAKPVK